MADLIDRQAAIEQAEKESQVEGAYGYMDTKSIVDMLEDLPKVDAVEVVRCKDCKYYNPIGVCIEMSSAVCEDSFCCWAERKENGKV